MFLENRRPQFQGPANFFLRLFDVFSLLALLSVFLVILAGSIVRMTGSGLGCPDWPKCFGFWIPPTQESQLPPDYQEKYKIQGKKIARFNAFKTWTEYINRLIGALAGLFVFVAFLCALALIQTSFRYTLAPAFSGVILMGLQGWLGAKVVSSLLAPYMITIHMILALIIVGVLLYSAAWYRIPKLFFSSKRSSLTFLVFLNLLLLLFQIGLGTQVREGIDGIKTALEGNLEKTTIESIGLVFLSHRSFSIFLLLAYGYQAFSFWSIRAELGKKYAFIGALPFGFIALEAISGIGLYYWGLPPLLQPFHLLIASLLFANQFFITLMLMRNKKTDKIELIENSNELASPYCLTRN
jgi:cytochrome c oxidase assembly protein subunit 15